MIKKFLKKFKYVFSYIISTNIYICRYLSLRLNLENHISMLEKELQNTQGQLHSTQEQLQKVVELLLVSHIKPNDLKMHDLAKCEVNFQWDSSRLCGLKYLFDEITYLLFFPRNPRTNKFIGYESVPQDTELVIIRFIENDIDSIWIQRNKEIINIEDDKLQTKDIK